MSTAKIPLLHTDILLVDFVGFSKLDDAGQYVAMSVVSRIMGNVLDKLARESFGKSLNMAIGWVPTGDGFYIILNPLATGAGVFAALGMRHVLMTRVNQTVGLKGVRCAVHHGPCVPFDDVTGKRNYIGSGLNDCARLLSLPAELVESGRRFHRDDNFFIASTRAMDFFFTAYPQDDIQGYLDVSGWRQSARQTLIDKHGKAHTFYFADVLRHESNLLGIPPVIHPIDPADVAASGF